ncbi:hypothetical protein D9M68_973780 [compost metagenome]
MPQHMGRDVLAQECGVGLTCGGRMLGKHVGDPVARHRLAVPIDEDTLVLVAVGHATQPMQRVRRLRP